MKFTKFLIYEPRACKEDSHHHTASWSSSCCHLVPSLHPHLFLCCSQLFPHLPMSLLPLLPLPYTQLLPEQGKIPASTQLERKAAKPWLLKNSQTLLPRHAGKHSTLKISYPWHDFYNSEKLTRKLSLRAQSWWPELSRWWSRENHFRPPLPMSCNCSTSRLNTSRDQRWGLDVQQGGNYPLAAASAGLQHL